MMKQKHMRNPHRLMVILMGLIVCVGFGGVIGALAATLAEKTPLTLPSPKNSLSPPRAKVTSVNPSSSDPPNVGAGLIPARPKREGVKPSPTGNEPVQEGAAPSLRPALVAGYGALPLSFEANQGQTDSQVQFLARGRGYTLFLTPTEAVLALRADKTKTVSGTVVQAESPSEKKTVPDTVLSVLRMKLEGANPSPIAHGLSPLPGIVNYFIGSDPKKWRTKIPTYQKVEYKEVYPGIDLAYYGNQGKLEYDLVVAPGADPDQIKLAFQGADDMAVDAGGNLVMTVASGEVRLFKPHVYQTISGKKTEVAASYLPLPTEGKGQGEGARGHQVALRVGLQLASYDRTAPLIIDPILTYSTYLGGSGFDLGQKIAADSTGNAYLTGGTQSVGFPGTAGSTIQNALASPGAQDAFVTKVNTTGTAIVYSTYLGGNATDQGTDIAVDQSGQVYVTGITQSNNFPGASTSLIQNAFGGSDDAFVAKLNAEGSAIVYSTYLGGTGFDQGLGIAVDTAGQAYVTGKTQSASFPGTATSLIQNALNGVQDAFVTKLNATGTAIVYSTFLGGSAVLDEGNDVAVDSAGQAYLTGRTTSTNFIGAASSLIQDTNGGGEDAFVTKLNAAGSAIVYSTYLGGSGQDLGDSIVVDAAGNAYVTGLTESTGFPVTPTSLVQISLRGTGDAFVTKLNASGSALLFSTYLGGSSTEEGGDISIDAAGQAYVTGFTNSNDFPVTPSPIQSTFGGAGDAFVTKLNASGSAILFSSYLGGSGFDLGRGVATSPGGNIYLTGQTASDGFPGSGISLIQGTRGGGTDAFVAKIAFTGNPFAWGVNGFGQLGTGNFAPSTSPTPVSNLTEVAAVAMGSAHSLALKPATSTVSSTVFSWGNNNVGQLGTGNNTLSNVPVPVTGFPVGTIPFAIAAGANHSLALTTIGGSASSTVFSWGENSVGQLGTATSTPSSNTPLLVNSLLGAGDVTAIAAGGGHSLALRGTPGSASSTLAAWGNNSNGELGQGFSGGQNSNPQTVIGPGGVGALNRVSAIAAGGFFNLALVGDPGSASSTVFAWGANSNGQLGRGFFSASLPTPTPVMGVGEIGTLNNVVAIAAGGAHALALRNDGTVVSWGRNLEGQLGNFTDMNGPIPVPVTGLTNVIAIAAGENTSYAQRSDGTLFAWGSNSGGQVGNLSCSPTCNVPVQVLGQGGSGFLTNVITVGTGSHAVHALAISSTAPLANVIVPNVVGQPSSAAADTLLTDAGLTLGTVTVVNNTALAGQVLAQTPIAGSSVALGTAVNLDVSSGPVIVPNVVGQPSAAAANTLLTGAGLTLGTVTVVNNIAPVGQVLAQNPTAGSSVAPGTAVNLTVSEGLPPVSTSIDARMLKAAGFNTFEIVGVVGGLDTAVIQNLTLAPSTSAYTLRAPSGGGPGEKTLTFKVNAQCDLTIP